ncbi:threonine/serine exporter family protein [Nesterenkonia salmonea]|uniref:Threonine/serine exporter family protein n=1 Tax=Nesterenkonia salmonea TaxID=1804987 RepID=A0A5R9BBT3_9MICC|nr:threonine/serine exporter family protein [Nesterenkonia salmonea]TLP98106.1 threonine/serine exporter family protein [Nesterenkonia salmonea]
MSDTTHTNRQAQRAAYGEPLNETFDRIRQAFGLNQASLASILGLSAPMLSQLNSAQRVKIGNPAVLSRVHQLNELVDQLNSGQAHTEEIPAQLEHIKNSKGTMGRTTQLMADQASDAAVVAGIRSLLRAVASGAEIRESADLLETSHPKLAEVLRIYGTGPAHPAVDHFVEHKDLF